MFRNLAGNLVQRLLGNLERIDHWIFIGVLVAGIGDGVNLDFSTQTFLTDNESCLEAPYTYEVSRTKTTSESTAATTDAASAAGASSPSAASMASCGPATRCWSLAAAAQTRRRSPISC